ncbi:MAG: RAMP superfamily CRISPR-associated protein [Gemmataceae bacterium]|nr:RAMP superfamily CRISPR-associated protein [Gemmataceae bacterium]MDW8265802.1 RAMP superfamily CRISPR-associated protein [Gemmataceae bacterium]
MARNVYCRFRLCGTLVAQSPLHVGGHGEDVDTDLPLARDGAGQWYVPGTSLAGALRSVAQRLFDPVLVEDVWGYQEDDDGHASFVIVEDGTIEDADTLAVEIRDHVGIDREFGCAAEHIKYDRAILPRGTRLRLELTVDVEHPGKRNFALSMLATLKEALETGKVRLGAAKTRGLGRIKLEKGQLTEQVLSTRQGILAWLERPSGVPVSSADIDAARQEKRPKESPRLKLTIHWKPTGPLMVKAGFDGIASDMLPLVSGIDGQVSLVLPGSSIKGALRFQAERIVRTLKGIYHPSWLSEDGKKKFLDALDVPLINELMGRRGEKNVQPKKKGKNQDEECEWLPGLGALSVADCYGKRRLSRGAWQAIQAADNDQQLRQALDKAGLGQWSQAYHVAIDRWLGSAAESFLYTVLEPHVAEWEPIILDLDLRRLPSKPYDLRCPAVALLFLVLRDLGRGRIPLGFATHRGMGGVVVEQVEIEGQDLPPCLHGLEKLSLPQGQPSHLPSELHQRLAKAWQDWTKNCQAVSS